MAKPKVKEVIVVEGRYDKNTLSQVVDAVIVELGGFAVFNDKEKQAFLRKLAKERGIILFTDPGHLRQGEAQAQGRQGGQARRRGHEAGNFA